MNKRIIIFVMLFPMWSSSQAITIDFNSLESSFSGGHFVGPTYTENNFIIEHGSSAQDNAFITWSSTTSLYTGSASLFNNTHRGETIISEQSNNLFSIFSIDLAPYSLELSTGDYIGSESILFTGTKSDNTAVEQVFNLGTTVNIMSTYSFESSFTDLVSLNWDQGSILGTRHQFDNIEVQAVPNPSSIILFSTGLIGMVSFARKRANKALK